MRPASTMAQTPLRTRAVLTTYAPGDPVVRCVACGSLIPRAWAQNRKSRLVRCNVYVDGRWDRLECFHTACYEQAGEPHGATGGFRNPTFYVGPGALAQQPAARERVQ